MATKIANVTTTANKFFQGEVKTVVETIQDKTISIVKKPTQLLNLFNISDKKIIELIYETHVHSNDSFDEDSLFSIVKNILNSATQVVDKIIQGSQVHVDIVEDFVPKPNFSVPLCTLKQIGSEFCCKAPEDEVAHNTTISILKKLSSYQWEAKAVLAIAAFALEYGDFWFLAQNYQSDNFSKSLAILKRVPVLTKPLELQKKRQAVLELNNVIKTLLQVIHLFDKFEKISITYDSKDVPEIKVALELIPVDVYWTILTIVACATKLNILISDEEKPLDLSPYIQKVTYTLNKLKNHLSTCNYQIEVLNEYNKIIKITSTPTEILDVIKVVFSIKHPQPIIDGSTNKPISLEVVRKKHVLLFLSGLDITIEDIKGLLEVYEVIKKENKYKIVWIPIVDEWTDELHAKFDTIKAKMPWFIIPEFSSPASFKFIKAIWNFQGKPMVLVVNPYGTRVNEDAFNSITLWGADAFPFDEKTEQHNIANRNWLSIIFSPIQFPDLDVWFKEEKYVFFYGGKDNDWIQRFTKQATAFINDTVIKESNIKIELLSVGKTGKGGEDHSLLSRFWSSIDNLFFSNVKKLTTTASYNQRTKEINKLLSYKNESGWVILSKGPTPVLVGHGFTILKVLEDFEIWKNTIREKGFENAFKKYHTSVTVSVVHCCRLDIPSTGDKVPEKMKCPECPRVMETFISYKCCHVDKHESTPQSH